MAQSSKNENTMIENTSKMFMNDVMEKKCFARM